MVKKIIFIITKSEAGGAQTHVFQMSRYLKERGYEVAVMSGQQEVNWLEHEIRKLGAIFYSNKFLANSYNPILGIKAMDEIRKAVKDFKPDLVSCHSTIAGFWVRLALRQAQGKPVVIFTAHGWSFTQGAPFLRRILGAIAEKIAGRYCEKIICVSDYDRNLALRYKIAPPKKLITIHNGVEISSDTNIRMHSNDANAGVRIIFVGRLSEPKDPFLLLAGFLELPDELQKQAQVEIIGDGPKYKQLERFVKRNRLEHRVILDGGLPREKVFEVLRNSDIFVLTSNYEGFPRSTLEAMSAGLPIIASDVGGVKEAVIPECGILVPRGDKQAIKRALETLITDSDLRLRLGSQARKRAEQLFSLSRMLQKTEEVYHGINHK